jgi:hypothetical protein
MEFLKTQTQFMHIGYSLIIFYMIAFIGFILIIIRPYYAFLFTLFCLSAKNFHAAVFTRTPFFGPYLNLNDLLLWLSFFGMIFELLKRRRIYIPKILLAIFGLLIIGDLQSLIKYGFIEEVFRRIWQTAIFPVLFLVSANMVTNIERAKLFFWSLFAGAIVASLQHLYYLISYGRFSEYAFRTISYITSGGLYLGIASIFSKLNIEIKIFKINFYYIGVTLIFFSYIASLTRGIYVVLLCILILMPFLVPQNSIKVVYRTVTLTLFFLLISKLLFHELNFMEFLKGRGKSFMSRETFPEAYRTRFLGQKSEIDLWLNSSIIFGVGTSLPPEFEYAKTEELGALYHVAYSSYLAHFGITGLLIYGILLPFLTIKIARKYYIENIFNYGGQIALMGISVALFTFFSLPWSFHFLGATSHVEGLIYGAIWGLFHNRIQKI